MGLFGDILGVIPGVGQIKNIAELGLGAIGAIKGSKQSKRADELNRAAIESARADRAARQPFRDQLLGAIQGPRAQREDLGAIFGTENPFDRPIPRPEAEALPPPPPAGFSSVGRAARSLARPRGRGDLGRIDTEETPLGLR